MRPLFLHILCFVICFTLSLAAIGAEPAKEASVTDPRLVIFLEKLKGYEQLQKQTNTSMPLGYKDHPLSPYRGKFIDEGLNEAHLFALNKAQQNLKCLAVNELEEQAFQTLYPYLKPAFEMKAPSVSVRFLVTNTLGFAGKRCIIHQQITEFLTRDKNIKFPVMDIGEIVKNKQYERPRTSDDIRIEQYATPLFGLATQAFCADYPPAIKDVLVMANRPAGILLTEREILYLFERLLTYNWAQAGVALQDYNKAVARIGQNFRSKQALKLFQQASRAHKITDHGIKVEGFWQGACREIQSFEQENTERVRRYLAKQ